MHILQKHCNCRFSEVQKFFYIKILYFCELRKKSLAVGSQITKLLRIELRVERLTGIKPTLGCSIKPTLGCSGKAEG